MQDSIGLREVEVVGGRMTCSRSYHHSSRPCAWVSEVLYSFSLESTIGISNRFYASMRPAFFEWLRNSIET